MCDVVSKMKNTGRAQPEGRGNGSSTISREREGASSPLEDSADKKTAASATNRDLLTRANLDSIVFILLKTHTEPQHPLCEATKDTDMDTRGQQV